MKKLLAIIIAAGALAGCGKDNNAASTAAADASATTSTPASSDDQYFSFAIDGEPKQIPIKDVFASLGYGGVFKIYAGADRSMSLSITVPDIANCPCTVAAGSTEPASDIGQGSVSLQHYPNPGNGLNSWYVGQEGTPAADAVRITDIGTIVDGARYVSGEFHTTVLKTESNGDGPENRDYVISDGKFRLRFETTGVNGF